MIFNSSVFFFFFVAVLFLYWSTILLPATRRVQNVLLLFASYFFYGWWDWLYLGLILASTIIDYVVARRLAVTEGAFKRKLLLGISVVLNLSLLGVFKYYDFFAGSLVSACHALYEVFGWGALLLDGESLYLRLVLPVGISFYTFQTMSYSIDVYRGVAKPERSLLNFALFVCFFPQLVAGPIERAKDLQPQIDSERSLTARNAVRGIWLLLLGYFMKVYVADHLGELVDQVYLPTRAAYEQSGDLSQNLGSMRVFLATLAFVMQVYCDFGGYSNIARGTALLMGFELSENFSCPQYARDPGDLYNRWHVTLNRWLTDYLYIPLGGSRAGPLYQYRNILVVFFMSGLWHGASWTFVLWGVSNGVVLVAYLIVSRWLKRFDRIQRWKESPGLSAISYRSISTLFTFLSFVIAAVFFRAYDLGHAIDLYGAMFQFQADSVPAAMALSSVPEYGIAIARYLGPLLILDAMHLRFGKADWIVERGTWLFVTVSFVLLLLIIVKGVFGKAVIYFAF